MLKSKFPFVIAVAILLFFACLFGALLGYALSTTKYIKDNEQFIEFSTALPTKLLDINGELITEFASEEKREIISIKQLPHQMIEALLSREDKNFYSHPGFNIFALFRAVIGQILHKNLGGGSTLTQQIAGTLYCDRTEMSYKRKLKELWWAIQMERRYSKDEIMELYLNKIYFGGGTYGVSAACKYYFGHDASTITPAEAAILVVQLSNPAYYNPFEHPERAMDRQKDVLKKMVAAEYLTQEEADESYEDYWATFDYTRTSSAAVFSHDDKAPWFSEYVRRELGGMIYGTDDIYTSGFTVNTTLNLKNQMAAQESMDKYIAQANRIYKKANTDRSNSAFKTYTPLSELLILTFNLQGIKLSQERNETIAMNTYTNTINPVVDVMSLMFGIDTLKMGIVNKSNAITKSNVGKNTIEGTMVALENDTGYITSLVGGSKFDSENQFIRAVQAKVQPGSSFKPLYYSAAIDSRQFTAGSIISDTPVVFHTPDGKPYIPQNFRGEWKGDVELWYALAHSMNVPSLKILDGIGFDAAIDRALALLGIPEEEVPSRAFVPGYPIGLGVCSVRPIEIARAYSVFATGGKNVTPIAIRNVEDKNGNIVLNPERELREKQKSRGSSNQIISPQTAYVMTQILENTVRSGTLASPTASGTKFQYKREDGSRYTIPAAGKTGTTQNWADAWAVGYTPYYTAAFWFGFDKPGQSLGLQLTGSTLAGPAMADFMQKAHEGLSYRDFQRPASGVVSASVCATSGMLPTEDCDRKVTLWYLEGTEPTEECTVHSPTLTVRTLAVMRLEKDLYKAGFAQEFLVPDDEPLSFNLDENQEEETEENQGQVDEEADFNYLMD